MTYQELKDRLSKCEYTLNCIKDGTLKDTNQKTVKKLELLKESLKSKIKEQEDKGMVVTRDSEEAEKLAKKGVNVNLKTEGPHQTTYIKVSKNDYKKAIQIIDQNIDREYVNTDIVDDDGDGNVIVYFNFTPATTDHDRYNPDSDPAEFIYDLSMDLQANGINITSASHDIDEVKDINDPVLMKLRATMGKIKRKKAIVKGGERHTGRKSELLATLKAKRAQVMKDMENDPSIEPEGGPVADTYGDELNKIDKDIAKASGRKPKSYDDTFNEGQDDIFALGYDLDATQYLVDYLKSKYKAGVDYELHIGRGDTHPNAVSLKNPDMEQDKELGNLLMSAGDNEETDYQSGREAENDYIGEKKRPGLWANIRAKKARGEKPAHKNSNAHKDAVKAGKKINKEGLWANINAKRKAGKKPSHGNSNAHKDAVKAGNKLKEEENVKLSKEHLSIIASKAGKAIVQSVHASGDEVSGAKIKKVFSSALSPSVPEAFTVHLIYKNDSEISYRFQIEGNKLVFLADGEDIVLSDVGVKPSGEPFINTELVKNEMTKYFKQMQEMNDQEFADAKEADRLANHPERDKILAIQNLIAKQKGLKETELSEERYRKVTDDDQGLDGVFHVEEDGSFVDLDYGKYKSATKDLLDLAMEQGHEYESVENYYEYAGHFENELKDYAEGEEVPDWQMNDLAVKYGTDYSQFYGEEDDDDIEEDISEQYSKEKLLAYLGQADDAMIRTHDDKYLIIYNPKKGNRDNYDMWGDYSVFAVDQDGEEHEVLYSDIDDLQLEDTNESRYTKLRDYYRKIDKLKQQSKIDHEKNPGHGKPVNKWKEVNEESEIDKITKAKRLIKQQAPAMNKLPQDDPKRKSFIEKVKQINQKHKELLDKEDDKISGTGRNQELDEGRGDFDDVLKAIENMSNNDDISERDAAAEIVLALADRFQLPVDKNLEDYMEEGESDLYEGTDLHIDGDFQFTRTNSGIQITERYSGYGPKSRYIHVPGRLLRRFVAGLAKSTKVFKDTKYQGQDAEDALKEADAKPIPNDIKIGYNQNIKNAQSMASALLSVFDQFQEKEPQDYSRHAGFKQILTKLRAIAKEEPDTPEPQQESGPGFAHDCAAKVVHEKYGKGNCIPEKHTLVKEGEKHVVTHYDVLFESGKTVKDIPVSELEIKTSNEHWHKGYKKKKK